MRHVRPLLLAVSMLLAAVTPGIARAGEGPAPNETCVPGTIWEDTTSGVKYICIYDELYGGTRWELLSGGQTGSDGWMYRSSSVGCAYGTTGLTSIGGSGADAIIRGYRWPCQTASDRVTQPAGELRARVLIQRYAGSGWSTCRDTGYLYSNTAATGWLAGIDMGAAADCGTGTYRAWGYGAFFQAGAWRSGSRISPTMPLR
jgi:hypothetical protein